jgi:hypothetical protein
MALRWVNGTEAFGMGNARGATSTPVVQGQVVSQDSTDASVVASKYAENALKPKQMPMTVDDSNNVRRLDGRC